MSRDGEIRKCRAFLIPLVIVCQLVFNASVGISWILPADAQAIPPGVTVNGKKVGTMSREYAISYLYTIHMGTALNKDIILTDGCNEWILNTRECGFRYDYPKTIDAVLGQTQWQGLDKLLNILKLQAQNLDMPFELIWDEDKLMTFLQTINDQVSRPARDSTLRFLNGSIHLTTEEPGEDIDVEMLVQKIVFNLSHGQTAPIHIDKKPLFPHISVSDLQKIDSDLAHFSTAIPTDEEANRYNNILLAAQMLDNTVIMPGETLSFNEKIGERSAASGFKKAPVIISNLVHYDLGGGICQVASTLYNASLLAGLEIVERSPHTVPVKYVPAGKDATVFFGLIDLKVKNTLQNPIAIRCAVDEKQLQICILGNHSDVGM